MRTDGRADKQTDGQTDTACYITLMFYVADVVSLSLSLSVCICMPYSYWSLGGMLISLPKAMSR